MKSWYFTLLTAALLFSVFACKTDTGSSLAKMDNHHRMLFLIDSVYKNSDPNKCYNLNNRKSAMYLDAMQKATNMDQKLDAKFNYADQQLKAGHNENAIMQFSEMINLFGDQLNDKTKIVYELLALCYMRMGEQQNCIDSHTNESCVLPLQGGGLYTMPAGPENAIKIYARILEKYPDDAQSRWLYNIAHMALGKWPQGLPAAQRMPESIFKSKSSLRFKEVAIPLGLDVRGTSGGIIIEDFDNDGNLDLFVTKYGLNEQCHLFHNNGDGSFSDRTQEANLMGETGGLNSIQADYDNDGDRDILILRGAWLPGGQYPNSLLRNNGDGTFTDVTIEAGLLSFHPTQAADWADYDGDGFLDLFIGNETYSPARQELCEMFHNNGNGTFTNLTQQLGLDIYACFKAVKWGDINNDQLPDLYLSNLGGKNLLIVNRGGTTPANWQFEDIAPKTGTFEPINSFPAFFFDYNNDGNDDIFVTDFTPNTSSDASATALINEYLGKQPPGEWLRLYRNNGNETFTDVHRDMGINTITYAMGNSFGDLNNDGWPDIFLGTGRPDLRALVPNRMFLNHEGKYFEDISMSGFSHIQKGHGLAFGDLDNDGDQDIYVNVGGAFEGDISNNLCYENPGNNNHWITLFLEGTTCNRDAFGAKIKVTIVEKKRQKTPDLVYRQYRRQLWSSSLRQELGLGQATKIESIEVRWPKPGVPNSIYTNVPMDKALKLKEGNPTAEVVPLKTFKFKE